MKKYLLLFVMMIAVLVVSGCGTKYPLGYEFGLKTGESAGIEDENLEFTFIEVAGDSRCPADVTCIWAGEATFTVRISTDGFDEEVEVVQTGLTNGTEPAEYGDYSVVFRLLPYPMSAQEFDPDSYTLWIATEKVR